MRDLIKNVKMTNEDSMGAQMKQRADSPDKPERSPVRRLFTVLAIGLSPIILHIVVTAVISSVNAVRTYRDIGVMPGSIVEGLEIKGEVPSWFTDEDMRSAADVLAENTNSLKFTVLDVEYDSSFQDYLEEKCPDYPDNCRMVLGFTEYNYGNDAANIGIHGREHIWAIVVRDDVNSPWKVSERGYI